MWFFLMNLSSSFEIMRASQSIFMPSWNWLKGRKDKNRGMINKPIKPWFSKKLPVIQTMYSIRRDTQDLGTLDQLIEAD